MGVLRIRIIIDWGLHWGLLFWETTTSEWGVDSHHNPRSFPSTGTAATIDSNSRVIRPLWRTVTARGIDPEKEVNSKPHNNSFRFLFHDPYIFPIY